MGFNLSCASVFAFGVQKFEFGLGLKKTVWDQEFVGRIFLIFCSSRTCLLGQHIFGTERFEHSAEHPKPYREPKIWNKKISGSFKHLKKAFGIEQFGDAQFCFFVGAGKNGLG